jgi:CheY-like chemotaxis protein/HPt (histidine-containing phosphotransfer) domain-containing protein
MGYTVDIAGSGPDSLAAVARGKYDLVFMDIQMPAMDGFETTRRIRVWEQQTGARPHIVIAMTANAMVGDREKCLAAGMDEYVSKPVRPEALQTLIERFGTARMQPGMQPGATIVPLPLPTQAAPRPPVSNEPLIDVDRLAEFSGGSMTSLIEITDLYLRQTQEQLDRIGVALHQGDTANVAKYAHSSAGASGVCGIVAMEPLFRELERLAKSGQLEGAGEIVETLRRNYTLVKDFLLNSRHKLPLS